MCGIDNQTNGVLLAERKHRFVVHRTVSALPIVKRHFLLSTLGTVIIG